MSDADPVVETTAEEVSRKRSASAAAAAPPAQKKPRNTPGPVGIDSVRSAWLQIDQVTQTNKKLLEVAQERGQLANPTPAIEVRQRLLMFFRAMQTAFLEEFNVYTPYLKTGAS